MTSILVSIPITSFIIYYQVCDNCTYIFPNFNAEAAVVWEWVDKFISHFSGQVIIVKIATVADAF